VLKTRIITALVILPIVLLALFAFPRWGWVCFAVIIMAAAAWEWRRLCKLSPAAAIAYYLALAACGCALLAAHFLPAAQQLSNVTLWVFVAAMIFWVISVPLWLLQTWRSPYAALDALAGGMVIVPTFAALLFLRDLSPWLLLSIAVIVWVADIAAYFAGKAFGRHKLAPAISPGKTVEGVIGGLAGVGVYFLLWRGLVEAWIPNEPWVRALQAQGLVLLVFFLLLGGISVIGDLFESWMKRGAGVKDSSHLLPGHGGILDRIDALTSTLPLAALFIILVMQRV
jgi:phosphatidate cytidylyltransferase